MTKKSHDSGLGSTVQAHFGKTLKASNRGHIDQMPIALSVKKRQNNAGAVNHAKIINICNMVDFFKAVSFVLNFFRVIPKFSNVIRTILMQRYGVSLHVFTRFFKGLLGGFMNFFYKLTFI